MYHPTSGRNDNKLPPAAAPQVRVGVMVGGRILSLHCDPAAPVSALGPLLKAAMKAAEEGESDADESDADAEEQALQEEVARSKRALKTAKAALAEKKKARRV